MWGLKRNFLLWIFRDETCAPVLCGMTVATVVYCVHSRSLMNSVSTEKHCVCRGEKPRSCVFELVCGASAGEIVLSYVPSRRFVFANTVIPFHMKTSRFVTVSLTRSLLATNGIKWRRTVASLKLRKNPWWPKACFQILSWTMQSHPKITYQSWNLIACERLHWWANLESALSHSETPACT